MRIRSELTNNPRERIIVRSTYSLEWFFSSKSILSVRFTLSAIPHTSFQQFLCFSRFLVCQLPLRIRPSFMSIIFHHYKQLATLSKEIKNPSRFNENESGLLSSILKDFPTNYRPAAITTAGASHRLFCYGMVCRQCMQCVRDYKYCQ